MRIKRKNSKTPYIIMAAVIVIVLIFIVTIVLSSKKEIEKKTIINETVQDNINYNPPTENQINSTQDNKKGNDLEQINNFSSYISSTNMNNDILQIRVVIDKISSNGTCNLTLNKGSVVINKTTETQPLPNSSTCKGFDIQKSEISDGLWNIKVTTIINNEESTAVGVVDVK